MRIPDQVMAAAQRWAARRDARAQAPAMLKVLDFAAVVLGLGIVALLFAGAAMGSAILSIELGARLAFAFLLALAARPWVVRLWRK